MTSITLIHGMYVTAASWQPWLDRAKAAGIGVKTIEWPGHEGTASDLRGSIRPELCNLNYGELVDLHAQAIGDEDTVLVGHSIGGLLVQSLLARGVGAAGVAICPAPPQGTLSLRADFVRANFPHTLAHKRSTPLEMDKERWRYCFANTLTQAAADAAWEQYCVPESRAVPLGIFTKQGAVKAASLTQPLLVFGASNDHLIPASLSKRIAKRYASAEYRERVGHGHLICNEPGWEGLADEIFGWAAERSN